MSDTPITDGCEVRFSTLFNPEDAMWVPSKKARELERQLNEAREASKHFHTEERNTRKAFSELNQIVNELIEAGQQMALYCESLDAVEKWNKVKNKL